MNSRAARWVVVALLLLLSLGTTGFGPATLVGSDSPQSAVTSKTLKQMRAFQRPVIGAKAAILMDATSGQVLFEQDSHARRAMASTTKIMTALVTLENARLDDVATASPNVIVEPSIIGLDPGDRLTVEQLLYGLMLPSGNDAALALAEKVGGSIPRFVDMMNAKAAQLGLKDTHFANPHGLDAPDHYSSAYDLSIITREAFKNPIFERIVATKEYRIEGPPRWVFKNGNQLLNSYPGADGVKTGFTDDAGRCLVFSATRDGTRAISVVLDSPDTWADSRALMDFYFGAFSRETLAVPDLPLLNQEPAGTYRRTQSGPPVEVVFPKWQRPYLNWYITVPPGLSVSSREGGIAGYIVYYLFGKPVAGTAIQDRNDQSTTGAAGR